MKCHVPVDLLRVEPRIWGDLETSQAICLFGAGVAALAALAGHLPLPEAVLVAGALSGYALVDLDGQPVRRLAPRIMHGIRRQKPAEDLDATLWLEADNDGIPHRMGLALHCLADKARHGR